jgi:hypothetical protein
MIDCKPKPGFVETPCSFSMRVLILASSCVAALYLQRAWQCSWQIFSAWSQEAAPTLTPSWETQRQAATYALAIPAPRGQITDRNGIPLAQNRVSNNLSVEASPVIWPLGSRLKNQEIKGRKIQEYSIGGDH